MTLLSPSSCSEILGIWFDENQMNQDYLPVDPAYGIPKGFAPVGDDGNGLLRPLSSFATVAAAATAFQGHVESSPYARGTDEFGDKIKLFRAGEREIWLDAATAVSVGDTVAPVLVNGAVSNDIFTVSGLNVIYTISRVCDCPPYAEDPCITDAAAADVSPSSALAQQTLSKVIVRWCTKTC